MHRVIYRGEKAEEIAALLNADEAFDSKDVKENDNCPDKLGFVIPLSHSALPSSIEKYVKGLYEKDSSSIGYIYAIFLSDGRVGWAAKRLQDLLEESGCILSYYSIYSESKMDSILKDIEDEKFKIDGHFGLYTLIKKHAKPYED